MKNGCVISIADEQTAAMVRAALLLGGISCGDGTVLVTDRMPDKPMSCTGIVLLSRTRIQETSAVPLAVLNPPLCFDELLAVVREMIDRSGECTAGVPDTVLTNPSSAEDTAETVQVLDGCVSYRGKQVQLTERECRLFECLRSREGKIVTRRELLDEVWDGADGDTNITDVYISYLRRKLTPVFGQGVLLTVRGQGYILHLPDSKR